MLLTRCSSENPLMASIFLRALSCLVRARSHSSPLRNSRRTSRNARHTDGGTHVCDALVVCIDSRCCEGLWSSKRRCPSGHWGGVQRRVSKPAATLRSGGWGSAKRLFERESCSPVPWCVPDRRVGSGLLGTLCFTRCSEDFPLRFEAFRWRMMMSR